MNPSAPTHFYPNKMGRIILLAMEEIIGRAGVNAVLNLASLAAMIEQYPRADSEKAFSFETISRLQQALERAYGPHGGRGVALRVGRACLKYGLREYGSALGLTEVAFRLLPLPAKLRHGAETFAALFNRNTDQRVRLERREGRIYWHIERCPLCWRRQAAEPICHLAVGVLQEALYWVSGGKIFNVEETHCIARGDATCTIVVDEMPVA